MENLGEKIIKTIKEKGIVPKPKWTFLLKDYSIWITSFICLIIGGFAFSVIIYMFRYNNWEVWNYVNNSFFSFVLVTLPYFWLVFLSLFVFLMYYNFKHTKRGYKYKILTIVAVSIILSMLLGVLLYNFGAGETIDDVLGCQLPFYQKMFNKTNQHMMIWSQPSKGLLSGTIISMVEDKIFVLQDFGNQVWQVNAQKAVIAPMVIIEPGNRIRIVGKELKVNNFEAYQIMPIMPNIRKLEEYPPIIRHLRKSILPIYERKIPDVRIIE